MAEIEKDVKLRSKPVGTRGAKPAKKPWIKGLQISEEQKRQFAQKAASATAETPKRNLGDFFSNFFSFTGRAPRSEFWMFQVFCFLCGYPLGFICSFLGMSPEYVCIIGCVAAFLMSLSVYVRRLHDLNLSGQLLLVFWGINIVCLGLVMGKEEKSVNVGQSIALTNQIVCIILLGFIRGTVGKNNYGEDPTADEVREKEMLDSVKLKNYSMVKIAQVRRPKSDIPAGTPNGSGAATAAPGGARPLFCTQCGNPLREGALFCGKCGARIVV